jgi:hypothetical protein
MQFLFDVCLVQGISTPLVEPEPEQWRFSLLMLLRSFGGHLLTTPATPAKQAQPIKAIFITTIGTHPFCAAHQVPLGLLDSHGMKHKEIGNG